MFQYVTKRSIETVLDPFVFRLKMKRLRPNTSGLRFASEAVYAAVLRSAFVFLAKGLRKKVSFAQKRMENGWKTNGSKRSENEAKAKRKRRVGVPRVEYIPEFTCTPVHFVFASLRNERFTAHSFCDRSPSNPKGENRLT